MSPRMAAKVHRCTLSRAECMKSMGKDYFARLPRLAKPFWNRSPQWREAYYHCFLRIALRLQQGRAPEPNCTGEEIAFHQIMGDVSCPSVEDEICDSFGVDFWNAIPECPDHDFDYAEVRDSCIEDEDVLMLFEDGAPGAGSDSDDEQDEWATSDPVVTPGTLASFALGSHPMADMAGFANLHPQDWFKAFSVDRFHDHLPAP